MMDISEVQAGDLTGIYEEIAQQVGVDITYKLFQYFRGQQLSFPLKFFSREYIQKTIISEYDGSNVRDLARKYGYTEARVRQLIRKHGEKE